MRDWVRKRPRLSIFLVILFLLIILLFIMAIKPFSLRQTFVPSPVESYEDAYARIAEIQAAEAKLPDLNPVCGTILLTHGKKVDNAIVFLHGFTSCPDQFLTLGKQYFDLGYNVLIPRQPRHGLNELQGTPLKGFSAEELATFGSQITDIAQGLGERVIMAGLSGGGAITTWLAQQRSDIDLAVPISPFLGVSFIPAPLTRPVTNLILLLPDIFQWWDPIHKMDNPYSAPYSYRGYYLHALFENLRLGFVAQENARLNKPAAGSILVITNANDDSINIGVVTEFEKIWREHGEQFLQTYQFDKALQVPHDLITVTRPGNRIDIVYPKLLELIK